MRRFYHLYDRRRHFFLSLLTPLLAVSSLSITAAEPVTNRPIPVKATRTSSFETPLVSTARRTVAPVGRKAAFADLRTPENPTNTVAGLDYKYYEGFWQAVPNFSALTPLKTGALPQPALTPAARDYGYAMQFTGYVTVPADGVYTFYANSDDGSLLYIGSTLVVNNDGTHGDRELSGTIGLQAGTHALTVGYLQDAGGQNLQLSYAGPGLSKQLIPATAYKRVSSAPTNKAPIANAGTGQTISLPTSTVTLAGSGTDSDGTIASYLWSQVSGPSTATFNNKTLAGPNVSGLVAGTYVFSLVVTDNQGALSAESQVTVTVNAASGLRTPENPTNTVAGLDYKYYEGFWDFLPAFNTLTPLKSGTVTAPSLAAQQRDYAFAFQFTGYVTVPTDGQYTFYSNSDDGSRLYIGSTLLVDNDGSHGDREIANTIGLKAGTHAITIAYLQGYGGQNLQVSYAGPSFAKTLIPASAYKRATTTTNQAPVANAGANQTITLPVSTATLTGSGTDADGTVASYAWTQVSGPNTATFSSKTVATPTVSGLAAGTYVFSLIVTDNLGLASTAATTTVTVSPAANQAPVANAGAAQTITLPTNTATLSGSGTDADGTVASYTWAQVSGPNAATFSSKTVAQPTVSGLVAGSYAFSLIVTDNLGLQSAVATTTVTVNSAVNQAPVANAGANQTITLPTSSATLSGSGTDADGTVASYTWAQVSGPNTATFSSKTVAQPTVSGLAAGSYVFSLVVTDNLGLQSAVAQTTVTVNSAANQAPVASAGANQAITLPTNSATLNGSGTDADGTIASYAWTQVSGPNTATFSSKTVAKPTVSGLIAGTYSFSLIVTDNLGLASAAATTTVTVNSNNSNLRTPENPANAVAGLDYKYYEGFWQAVPNFSALTPLKSGSLSSPALTPAQRDYGYAMQFTGYVTVPADGVYTFYANSDDGSLLYIGSTLVVNNDGTHGDRELSGTIGLQAGTHALTVGYLQDAGGQNLQLSYAGPGLSKQLIPATAYKRVSATANQMPVANAGTSQTITLPANSLTLAGSGTDSDGTIASYLWSQVSGPGAANFSSTTVATPTVSGLLAGTYVFNLVVTDNLGALSNPAQVSITVNANNTLRTPENPTNAVAGLDYKYYEGFWDAVPNFSTLTPTKTGTSTTFSLAPQLRDYGFSFQFTGYVTVPTDGQYTFYTNSDDGSLLYIGSTLVVNNDGSHGDREIASTIGLKAGTHAITVAYLQGYGGQNLQVSYAGPSFAKTLIPTSALKHATSVTNQAPVANAGANQTITLPVATATLNGSGTDADGTIASYLWAQVSGPNTAVFSSKTIATPAVSSLAAGTYVFSLIVTDNLGVQSAVATTSVVVNPAANQAPVANAGANQAITLPVATGTLNGSGTDADGTIASYAWTQVSGPNTATFSSKTVAKPVVSGLAAGTYSFSLIVTDNLGLVSTAATTTVVVNPAANQAPVASAGANQTITLPTSSATLSGSGTDADGTVASYTWAQVSGPNAATFSSKTVAQPTVSGLAAGSYVFSLVVTDNLGLQSAVAQTTVTVNSAANQAPVANAGANRTITLPTSSLTLSGSATDADGTVASYTWAQVSGPNTATFSNKTVAQPVVSGLIAGSYVFSLVATDNLGLASAAATTTVTVNSAANQAPVASAGANQTITLPTSSATLSGSATDADGTVASYTWAQVSGPNTATFTNKTVAQPVVSGLVAGSYVFSLVATDNLGLSSAAATTTVTVNPAANQAPVASAGANQAITLPTNSATLNGSGTDADGTVASYTWAQVSGPNTATFSSKTVAKPTVSGLIAGTYSFSLIVTDNLGLASTAATTSVVVSGCQLASPTVTTPVTYCQNATASPLSASVTLTSGATLNIYTAATGGTALASNFQPSTSTIGNTTYYVSQSSGTCESARVALTVSITTPPGLPNIATSATFCLGNQSSALTTVVTAPGSTQSGTPTPASALRTYTTATGGTALASDFKPSTSTVGTTTYYISQVSGTCEGPRLAVTVNVVSSLPAPKRRPVAGMDSTNIAAWGDSFTDAQYGYYPQLLGQYSGYNVANLGIGGQTSVQIKDRMLADTGKRTWPTIIWAGRNDSDQGEQVKASIAAMVAALPHKQYIVVSVYNGAGENPGSYGYEHIRTLNADLASIYGSHFMNIRPYTVSQYDPTQPQDVADYNDDIPPFSLRSDFLHPNKAGCTIIANYMYAHIEQLFSINYCQNTVSSALSTNVRLLPGATLKVYTTATGGTGVADFRPSTTAIGSTTYYVSQVLNGCESPRTALTVNVNNCANTATATSTSSTSTARLSTTSTTASVSAFDVYPNPFSRQATVEFTFNATEAYTLDLYDSFGRKVQQIATGTAQAGALNTHYINGTNLNEGLYIVRLTAGKFSKTFTLTLSK